MRKGRGVLCGSHLGAEDGGDGEEDEEEVGDDVEATETDEGDERCAAFRCGLLVGFVDMEGGRLTSWVWLNLPCISGISKDQ